MSWERYENIAKQVKELERKQKENEVQEPKKDIHGDCDYVWTPENGTATILYIVTMIFGAIFNARILIWIVATLVYFNFINRHEK
jgi:hypothetical protein